MDEIKWRRVDLHMHSNESDDGQYSPDELFDMVKAEGLDTFALTDHDVLAGTKRMLEKTDYGKNGDLDKNQRLITGVELSTSYFHCTECKKGHPMAENADDYYCDHCGARLANFKFHLLGYAFDVYDKKMNEKLDILSADRRQKYERLCEALKEQRNIEIPKVYTDRLYANKDGKSAGSSDLAKLLIQLSYVNSIKGAYEHYIKKLKYDEMKLNAIKAIKMIHDAKGLAVLAHPIIIMWSYGLSFDEIEELCCELKKHGLDGLEVFFAENSKNHTAEFKRIARKLGLFMTGGSDFHGHKYHAHLDLGKIGPA